VQKPDSFFSETVQRALSDLQQSLVAHDPIRARLPASVRVYCVGGAVRDALLGQSGADRDFVVVGANVEDMLSAGFTPVGKDFPVFLHPVTHDEYALARTERKSGKGYKGFVFNASPTVTLDDDLSRRDLSINAIALGADGVLLDPFHGVNDLSLKVFRHIGPAFSDDPVRLLRIARFASRWPDFSLAPETLDLCRSMVAAGETKALVPERVWQEIQKGLMERQPSKMLGVLVACGAWKDLHDNIVALRTNTGGMLDACANNNAGLEIRYALLVWNDGQPQSPGFLKAPRACIDMAALCVQQSEHLNTVQSHLEKNDPEALDSVLAWLMAADLVRKPERFAALLQALMAAGQLQTNTAAMLESFARLLTSDDATTAVARAAHAAQAADADIAAAARRARREILQKHSWFQAS
jgi:tRNA nucleotidyltransferase (CCA-adding enzyme)